MSRGLHYFALTCLLTLFAAAPMAAATTPPATGKTTSTKAKPARKAPARADSATRSRDKALLAFQSDLVSVLALRADAMPLLGAALIARPLLNQPNFSDFHALIQRATHADDADAAVNWARLADCDSEAGACPNDSALQKLLVQAPDNAAVWLLKLGIDTRDLKPDEARADLAQAANAKLYDDYTGTSLMALARSVGVLPPPPATINPAHAAGAAGVQVALVFGVAGTQPQPSLQITAKLCENAGDDASIKADCLKLGKLLEWGSSPLARSLGLHLREVLSDDPAQQQDAARARLNLIWQVQNFAELSSRASGDKALAQHLLSLARNGGTEMSLLLATLRDYSIPTDAPVDWRPAAASR